jgi:hypothetical protein
MTTVRSPSWVGINNLGLRGGRAEGTYNDEDPAPAFETAYAVHESDSVRKDSTKCTGEGGSREEKRNPVMRLCSLVPHREVEDYPRKQSTLCDAQEESSSQESCIVL